MSSIFVKSPISLASGAAIQRLPASIREGVVLGRSRQDKPMPSTVLNLGTQATNDVVYAKPTPADSGGWVGSPWRGLGGALLTRFAATGLDVTPEQSAPDDAAKASLKIRTRSGQTIELNIAVGKGSDQGPGDAQLEVKASGPLSSAERKALAALAEGLDAALEGLGQADQPSLDLTDLMTYDSSVLGSVDLSVKHPGAAQPLSSFNLHLGDDRKAIQFNGAAGEMAVSVDTKMPMGAGNAQQRQSSIDELLRKFDAAAERSHADQRLLVLFKDAFTQLQSTPSAATALPQRIAALVQPLQSGLADFEASFHSAIERKGEHGALVEKGDASYEVRQKTAMAQTGGPGDLSIQQTLSETLTAQSMKSRTGIMLDTEMGNYDILNIRDSTVTITSISTDDGKLSQAERQTEQHLLRTIKSLVNHRVDSESSTPLNKRFTESLR